MAPPHTTDHDPMERVVVHSALFFRCARSQLSVRLVIAYVRLIQRGTSGNPTPNDTFVYELET